MRVKYFAYIRDYTRCREAIEENCATVYELLHKLSDKYGEQFRSKVLTADGEDLGEDIIILVNGRHVEHIDGIKTSLKEDDSVSVFPVVAGG